MLKIGVLGAGHLGKIHIKLIKEIKAFELLGFYDPNEATAKSVENEFLLKRFDSVDALIEACDVVDIVTPTLNHYECAVKAIKKSKHVFIEKPLTNTIEEAKELLALVHEADVKAQVGHVERFNPAFTAVKPYCNHPMFIETHRLAEFNPRGTDVSVVLDLMIHDIDIILSIVNSNIKRISASGVAVVSDSPDITNARIEFDNGCVANLTASRISLKNMRKTRIFQRDAYLTIDFLDKKAEIIRLNDVIEEDTDPLAVIIETNNGKKKRIFFESPKVEEINSIKRELETFAEAIINNSTPLVTIDDGYKAIDVAYQVIEKLKLTANFLSEAKPS